MPNVDLTPTQLDLGDDEGILTDDIPEQTDFSRGVRGPAGVALMMTLSRLREALRTIRDTPNVDTLPLQAACAMQAEARRALSESWPPIPAAPPPRGGRID